MSEIARVGGSQPLLAAGATSAGTAQRSAGSDTLAPESTTGHPSRRAAGSGASGGGTPPLGHRGRRGGPRPPRRRHSPWIPLALVLAGIGVLLYPVVATQLNNHTQQKFAQTYNDQVAATPRQLLDEDFRRAQAYNASITSVPILDPFLSKVSATDPRSGPYRGYLSQLSRFDAIATVRVPAAKIDLPVRHGTSDPVLAEGAGHLYGTSLPVGGKGTHAVMTSHTGIATATLFDHLTSVTKGDLMYVEVLGRTLAYKVDEIKVVKPNQISDLKAVRGKDYLTLFTCTPYAVNTHRLLVRGHRVPYVAEKDPGSTSPWLMLEGWMWWLIGGSLLSILIVLLIAIRERKRRREEKAA